jgi:hypothetical protein
LLKERIRNRKIQKHSFIGNREVLRNNRPRGSRVIDHGMQL